MRAAVDKWSEGPENYTITTKMRKARQLWNALNTKQKAWSNEVHEYEQATRLYMPYRDPPRVARDSTGGKIKELVRNYAGRVNDRHEFAMLNFIRRKAMLQHCKVPTVLQEKAMHK